MTAKEGGEQNVIRHPEGGMTGVLAMGFILAGWIVAVVLGHGWELHRIVLTIPFAAAGALLACGQFLRGRVVVWKPVLFLLAAGSLYFVVRAGFSPVRDFGRADVLLVTMFAVSFLGGAACLRARSAVTLVLKAMILIFVAHLLVSIYQRIVDPSFAVFRLPRQDQDGVSGLFWHRNYLAGMLELILPVFLAIALTTRLADWRVASGLLVLFGVPLLFFTQSRAGFMAAIFGMGMVAGLFLFAKSMKWTTNKRLAAVAGAIAVALAIGWMGFSATSKVSEQRGQSGDIEEALGVNGRLAFSGMAFDQWTEQPLWGTGSRSFSYKGLDHWNAAPWIGHPIMVHNDYMQTLAEYGLPGILLVVGFAVALLIRGFVRVRRTVVTKEDDGFERALVLGALGALMAAMVHSVFDFSLHILPNLMLLGILTGFLVGPAKAEARGPRQDAGLVVLAVGVLLASAALACATGWREVAVSPRWARWEWENLHRDGPMAPEKLDAMGELVAAAPEFGMARKFGRMSLETYRQDPIAHARMLAVAEDAYRLAATRHPYDAETLANLAYILELEGRFDEATAFHLRAVARTWRREGKYGAMAALASNLARRAEGHLYRQQGPEALGFYQRALEYLDASRQSGFRSGGARQSKEMRAFLAKRIEALQSEGVEIELPPSIPSPPP